MGTSAKAHRSGIRRGVIAGLVLVLAGTATSAMAQTANTKTTYTYDVLDRLTQVTDPSGLNTTYQYDGLSDPTSTTSPDSGVTARTYDAAGNVLTGTDAKGNTVTYTYDVQNRRLSASYADSTQNIAYSYDEPNNLTDCTTSYPIGHLTRVVQNTVTTLFCYNAQGYVIQKSQTVNGHTDVTTYTRSPAGRILSITHPSGNQVNYTYDADGRVSGVTATTSSGTTTLVSNVSYLPFGPISGYTLGNGQAITRTYDTNYRLTDLVSPAFTLHVVRDAMGDITAIGNSAGANPATETYSYDPLYRLTAITEADGSTLESVTYNQTGDRLSKTGSGLATGTYSYNTNTHQLIATGNAARTVDANGNTTAISQAGSTYGFGYNARNRMALAQLNQSTVAAYTYNAYGERVAKTASASTERYNYDPDSQLLSEYGSSNREYVYLDDIPVANLDTQGTTASIVYVTADHLGTPRAIADGSGNIVWSWAYQGNAWGEQSPTSNGYVYNLRFPGQYYDAESGLNNNFNRDYDKSTGRYAEVDPIGQAGGLGLYVYGLNNPLAYSDPLGLAPGSLWGATGPGAGDGVCRAVGKPGRDCEEQTLEDEAICRSLPNVSREQKAIRARCWASVQERNGACKAGRPLPPLVTWFDSLPDTSPANPSQNPNSRPLPVLPVFEQPLPVTAPVTSPPPTLPVFEPVIP
jgi:RHS repeat-associated protein